MLGPTAARRPPGRGRGPHASPVARAALSLGARLGGNGALIGASANLTTAGLAERAGVPFGFWTYTRHAFPLMLVSIVIAQVYLLWRYL